MAHAPQHAPIASGPGLAADYTPDLEEHSVPTVSTLENEIILSRSQRKDTRENNSWEL